MPNGTVSALRIHGPNGSSREAAPIHPQGEPELSRLARRPFAPAPRTACGLSFAMFNRHLVLAVALTLLSALFAPGRQRASAQRSAFDPQVYSSLHWRMIGPFRGGRVNGVSGVPGRPSEFYFGSVGGGVWKTSNAGRTWTPVFDSQPIASIGAIGVAPSSPDVVYVGTGEADMRSQISYGNGMYKSADAGASWRRVGLDNTRQIG